MFGNLSWYEVVIVLLVALFIFGDKLPKAISDGLRMLRNLRRMAQNATSDLSRELGTDIQLEDLHPKTFIRKHLISEADQEALVKPLKGISDDLVKQTRGISDGLKETADEVKQAAELRSTPSGRPAAKPAGSAAQREVEPAKPAPQSRPAFDDVT